MVRKAVRDEWTRTHFCLLGRHGFGMSDSDENVAGAVSRSHHEAWETDHGFSEGPTLIRFPQGSP